MPGVLSHRNTSVSKIWIVVLFSFVMMLSIVWKLFEGLQEIAINTQVMNQQINELMNEPHCSPATAGSSC